MTPKYMFILPFAFCVVMLSTGCASRNQQVGTQTPTPPRGGTPAAPSGKAGVNRQGNVVDSSKVEAGSGRVVKGLNNFEGEITGKPQSTSKFARLQIGMTMAQVLSIAGQPTDQGTYITGKAWIPFYYGADRHRFELVYRGHGRLILAGASFGDRVNGNLVWIIHNAVEPGTR